LNSAKKLLIGSGLALAIWGMAYGFFYAVSIEHQTLEKIGSSLEKGFTLAAERKLPEARAALDEFANASYVYVRQVDAHGHWIGLSMLLIVFGTVFHRVGFGARARLWLACGLVAGAAIFPLGVLLETFDGGWGPKFITAAGSAVITLALGGIAAGFARERRSEL
jgi:dipeptide/tripeptide permease